MKAFKIYIFRYLDLPPQVPTRYLYLNVILKFVNSLLLKPVPFSLFLILSGVTDIYIVTQIKPQTLLMLSPVPLSCLVIHPALLM